MGGTVSFTAYRSIGDERYCHLFTFDASPKGKGFGAAGYRALEESMKKAGCVGIRLESGDSSGFWSKMGYQYKPDTPKTRQLGRMSKELVIP